MRIEIAVLAVLAASVCGCANVKQYERERLASPAMARGLGETGLAAEYGAKLWESRTGGGLPGDAPGGGCGCTQ